MIRICLLCLTMFSCQSSSGGSGKKGDKRIVGESGYGVLQMGGGTCKRFTDKDVYEGKIKCEDLDHARQGGCCPSKQVQNVQYCDEMRIQAKIPTICKKYPKQMSCQADSGKWERRRTGTYDCQ